MLGLPCTTFANPQNTTCTAQAALNSRHLFLPLLKAVAAFRTWPNNFVKNMRFIFNQDCAVLVSSTSDIDFCNINILVRRATFHNFVQEYKFVQILLYTPVLPLRKMHKLFQLCICIHANQSEYHILL